jgi:hypothetical protein
VSRRLAPSDFRLTFADGDLRWAEERRPGLPILRWPDGTICEPVTVYFGYSAEVRRVRPGSMRVEAYAIREWLAFLANARRRWDEADDGLLSRWRESHREDIAGGRVKASRVAHKLECVFRFYQLLPEALPFDEGGSARRSFVGRPAIRDGVTFPLTSKAPFGATRAGSDIWSGMERARNGRGSRRGTPDERQVAKILAWLRSKSDRHASRRRGAEAHRTPLLESERNWLMGRCMVDGGLRAQEVADMGLDGLAKALRLESLPLPKLPTDAAGQGPHVLDLLADDPGGREAVLVGLEALSARGRTCLYVQVTGKGSKTRMVPFPIDLMRDLLQIGVWTVRRARLAEWAGACAATPPPVLFLSSKTKGAMTSGTIGDLMKAAFVETGVEGSGHRLRAHFATMMAARLLDECLAQNNYRLDHGVENMVLERLAEALGHAQVTTTLRHYVEMAKLRHFGAASRAKLDTLRGVKNSLLRNRAALSPDRMRLVGRVSEALAAAPDDSDLAEMIELAVADAGGGIAVADPAPSPPENKSPRLRLVDGTE